MLLVTVSALLLRIKLLAASCLIGICVFSGVVEGAVWNPERSVGNFSDSESKRAHETGINAGRRK